MSPYGIKGENPEAKKRMENCIKSVQKANPKQRKNNNI